MTKEECMEAALRRVRVIATRVNSMDPGQIVLCERIQSVNFTVPKHGKEPFWAAECVSLIGSCVIKARVEDVKLA